MYTVRIQSAGKGSCTAPRERSPGERARIRAKAMFAQRQKSKNNALEHTTKIHTC